MWAECFRKLGNRSTPGKSEEHRSESLEHYGNYDNRAAASSMRHSRRAWASTVDWAKLPSRLFHLFNMAYT